VRAMGPSGALWKVMSDVFAALRGPLMLLLTGSDASTCDEEEKWARKLMMQLVKLLPGAEGAQIDKAAMDIIAEWCRTREDEDAYDYHKHRMLLVSLALDSGELVTAVLWEALDATEFDEKSITAALRTLMELANLEALSSKRISEILDKIREPWFLPKTRDCHSAYVGSLATFSRAALLVRDSWWADALVCEIVATAQYWLPHYRNEGVLHEAVWALRLIMSEARADVVKRCAQHCIELVDSIDGDWCLIENAKAWSEAGALSEANKIFDETALLRQTCSSRLAEIGQVC